MKHAFVYSKMGRNKTKIQLLIITLCFLLLCYVLLLLFNPKERNTSSNLFGSIVPEYYCGKFPSQESLNISDKYWQVTNTTNGTFYLFNAYIDDREAVNGSVVRILGLINKLHPTVETYCQLWFSGMQQPISSKVFEYRVMWFEEWGENQDGATPYLISCKNPLEHLGLIPSHVSLVEEECATANNVFSVTNKRPKNGLKKLFLVCLRALNFADDISLLLIEWAEFLKVLGADNVVIYVTDVHPNVIKVIDYYRQSGFFMVKFIRFPHELPNKETENWHQWIQNELISYNDAFYEYLYEYAYFVPLDIDEFIMPLLDEDKTWLDLLTRTIVREEKDICDEYYVNNMYFLLKSVHQNERIEGIPKNLRFLSNIYHCSNYTLNGGNAKSFMRTDRVLTVHNHFPFSCIHRDSADNSCRSCEMNINDGLLWHFRIDCDNPECVESKPNPVKDTRLWKYRNKVMRNVIGALERMGRKSLLNE